MDILYKRIKSKREELGMSQEDLARRVGYKSRSSINKIELGLNDLPQSKVLEFAKVFNVTPAYLMGLTDEEQEAVNFSESKNTYGDHNTNLEHLADKPELLELYNEIYENETLQILFDNAKDLDPKDLEVILMQIKGIRSARGLD